MGRPKSTESIFPHDTLENTLKIAKSIGENYAGKNTAPILVAQSSKNLQLQVIIKN